MNRLLGTVLLVWIGAFVVAGHVSAGDECGAGLDGNWNVKHAGDIKSHLKHHLKIEKTSAGKYSVKIKSEGGDIVFKSAEDFNLSCSGDKATLSGDVKYGNCMHELEIGYAGEDEISIKIPTVHDKGECTGHKDMLHEGDRKNHKTVATGKRRGSGKK
jgi:hypothetical protein